MKGLLRERHDACIYPFDEATLPQSLLIGWQQRNDHNSCTKELVSPGSGSPVAVLAVDTRNSSGREPELPMTDGLHIFNDASFAQCHFGWVPWIFGRLVRHCLPERLILATQDKPDLPDAAVAIALAAHLNRIYGKKDDSQKATVIMVPRYLEANPELEERLRKRSWRVREALVVGGSDVMTADLRSHLRGVLTPRDPKNSWGGCTKHGRTG